MTVVRVTTGERLVSETMPNGLKVFVMEKPAFQRKYAVLATKYGSMDSKFQVVGEEVCEVPDGIAHFLEHKMFEEEDGHVFERFSQFGASVNAYTSYTMTSYLFSTIDCFAQALQELLRFVRTPYLTAENVKKEKGIIEQELRMYDDHPDRRIYRNLLSALYHEHPIRLNVGGTVESIAKIDVERLMQCYNTFYQPTNMALFVVGDVEGSAVVDLVNQATADWFDRSKKVQRIYPDEPLGIKQDKIEQSINISQPRYYLGFKDQVRGEGKDLLKQQLAMAMIWRSVATKSSPIFTDLYAQGIIDDSFGASFSGTPQYAFSVVGGETDNPEKLDRCLRKAIDTLKKKKLTADTVERLKRRSLGNYLASFNSLDYIANSFLAHEFNGTSLLDFPSLLQSLTIDDVNSALEHGLDWDKAAISLLYPE